VQLTPQNSEEQAMLDIMEMRGFGLIRDKGGRQLIITTPDGTGFAVQLFPYHSDIQCVFACFETLNTHYK
jgi:hypothetical protein